MTRNVQEHFMEQMMTFYRMTHLIENVSMSFMEKNFAFKDYKNHYSRIFSTYLNFSETSFFQIIKVIDGSSP